MANLTIDEITQFWLLTSATDFARALGYFFPEVYGLALNMKEVPGVDARGYADALLNLYDSGMIEFSSEISGDDIRTRPGISKILDRFLSLSIDDPAVKLRRNLRLDQASKKLVHNRLGAVKFKLTNLGGDAWERIAEPAWDHFFDQRSDDETGELYSQDLTLLVARLGWFIELAGSQIDINTIKLRTHSKYQILYWKMLPNVHHATFSLKYAEPRWTSPGNLEPKWFWDWWTSTTDWHKKPWDLPNWPSQPI